MQGRRRLNRTILLVVLLGMLAPIAAVPAKSLAQTPAGGTVSFPRGDAGRTGAMPGPGPQGEPEVRWKLEVRGYASAPVVEDGVAYISTGNGELFSIDIATGEKVRDFRIGDAPLTALGVVDNVLYVGVGSLSRQGEGMYLALNAATGRELWRFVPGGPIQFPRLTVVGDIAYLIGDDLTSDAFADQTVYAVDVSNEPSVLWRFTPSSSVSSLAVSDSVVYFGSGGTLYGLDVTSGRERFRFAGVSEVQSPAVENGVVVFVDRTDNVWYGVDGVTGEELWSFEPQPFFSTPALVDGVAYVNGDNVLYALDAQTGEELWSFEGGDDFGAPSVVGDTVYVGSWRMSHGGWLFAIDAETGEERWRMSGQGNFAIAQPVVVDGLVLITTGTGEVYAIGGDE